MLYVLRLTTGDCIVTAAEDERNARDLASSMLQAGETIASVRPVRRFGLRFSPSDSGSLDVNAWDDATLDDILANEYPRLNEAFHQANSVRFMPPSGSSEPLIEQLRAAHDQNTEIIRQGLRLELERFSSQPMLERRKAARK